MLTKHDCGDFDIMPLLMFASNAETDNLMGMLFRIKGRIIKLKKLSNDPLLHAEFNRYLEIIKLFIAEYSIRYIENVSMKDEIERLDLLNDVK